MLDGQQTRDRPFNIPQDKVDRLTELVQAGQPARKIAAELGIAKSTVYRIARKLGLISEKAPRPWWR